MDGFKKERSRRALGLLVLAVLVLSGSAIGIVGLIALFGGSAKLVIVFVAGILFLGAGFFSGNLRLYTLYACVFVAPLTLTKSFLVVPHMGGSSAISFSAIDPLLAVLLCYQLRDWNRGKLKEFAIPLPLKFFLFFVFIGLITVVTGPFRTLAFFEVFRGLQMAVIMFVILNELRSRSRIQHFLTAMMIAVFGQSLFGIAQYIYGKPFGLQFLGEMSNVVAETLSAATLEGGEASFRISSLLGHANLFAIYLASQIPIFLGLLFTKSALWWRTLAIVTLALAAVALLLTLSRTGWVAAGVGVGGIMTATLFHSRMRGKFLYGRMGFILAVALFGVAFSGPIITRLTKSDKGAVNIRWELLEVAGRMGRSEPVFGKGLNSFIFQMAPYTKYKDAAGMTEYFGENWPVVHNLYALIWAEQGTVGVVVFLTAMTVMAVWALPNVWSQDGLIAAVAMGCFLGFVAYGLDWMASFSLRQDTLGRMFALHMALYFSLEIQKRARLAEK